MRSERRRPAGKPLHRAPGALAPDPGIQSTSSGTSLARRVSVLEPKSSPSVTDQNQRPIFFLRGGCLRLPAKDGKGRREPDDERVVRHIPVPDDPCAHSGRSLPRSFRPRRHPHGPCSRESGSASSASRLQLIRGRSLPSAPSAARASRRSACGAKYRPRENRYWQPA